MKIIDTQILRGPNYYLSHSKKLIEMKVDLGITEYCPINKIEGLAENLERFIPTLKNHFCSAGESGGFLKRVREGTWMGHVIEHIAMELQTLADMSCGHGRTRSAGENGIYIVVFSYEREDAGLYAGKAALKIVETLLSERPYDIEKDLIQLEMFQRCEGPSTLAVARRNFRDAV
ncbi:MAG: hypothetical protein IPM96_08410 [Ignavibacteria bacterium]|nr:hypothetical protein [Ignavibacteria bacterium]